MNNKLKLFYFFFFLGKSLGIFSPDFIKFVKFVGGHIDTELGQACIKQFQKIMTALEIDRIDT